LDYDWPGNVRELKNYVERAVLLEESRYITPASLPDTLTSIKERRLKDRIPGADFREQVMLHEKDLIVNALKTCKGKKKEAAKLLGLSPRLFSYYLKKYRINKAGEGNSAS